MGNAEESDVMMVDLDRNAEDGGEHYSRGKDRDKTRDSRKHRSEGTRKKDRDDSREERGKEEEAKREDKDHGKDRHRDRERSRGKDRGKDRETRKEDREVERERGKDRGKDSRERDYDREKERVRGHDKEKDSERGKKEREKDRDRDRSKEKERSGRDHREEGKDYYDRSKDKGKGREKKEVESKRETDDKLRAKDRESDRRSRGKEARADDSDDGKTTADKVGEVEDEGAYQERSSKDRDEKPAGGSQSASEIQERLIKMKQERLKRKSDDASEIASWVNKSRKLNDRRNTEKEKAARTSRQFEEQDNIEDESEDEKDDTHGGKDLAGVKILHGLDKVIEGGAVVLTLKDQSILADGDINEEMDMLENVEIGEQKQRDEAYKASKKRTGIYEDKFSDDTGSWKPILPQYDDPVEDEGVTLDASGRFTGEAEKKLDELRKRIEGGSIKRTFEDLTSSGKNSSDYFTPDEMLQFKKPKKKKSLRKREKLDLDALEAEAISTGLGVGDLGSRSDSKRQSAKEQEARIEAEMRNSAYQAALAKAEVATKALRQEQTRTVKSVEDNDMVFGEDYEDLEKSLEQARKLALKRKEESSASGPRAAVLMAMAKKEQEDTQSLTAGEPQENRVVITEMEEFVLGLHFNEEIQRPDAEDVFKDDEDDIPTSVQHDVQPDIGGWAEIKETLKDENPISEEKEDIAPDEIIHESAIGKGLSGALKLLKDRGTLNEGTDWGGRNMDKKKSKLVGINDSDGSKEIRIERTDEFGRIMTPKEAFRVISHKFHGKGPGKMKQEKRMKQYQEDLKTKQMKASDTPSLAMERMREVQAQSKMPYLVISGHVKPGQTSDPRSGFATVEKDLGSLTPMLGDKKVEHFLGINRKPEAGSMGPPPPRKPKS